MAAHVRTASVFAGSAWMSNCLPLLPAILTCVPAGAGSIHQAEALSGGGHSLHVTISACQRTTWADFLAVALPRALDLAAEASTELRQSLPRDAFGHLVRPARLIHGLHAYVCR